MELAYSPPILPPTAPLRLTPKSPRTSSFPAHLSSKTGYISPVPAVSFPSSASVRRTASNPGRAPTPSLAKRMKSTSVLQQTGAFPREGNRTVVMSEAPVTASKVRQGHVGGKLSGRLSGLGSLPKGRTADSAESGVRIDISTSSYSSWKPRNSPSTCEAPVDDSMSSPGTTTRAKSPTAIRRRWPFASGSFWPRASHANPTNAPESPSSSSESSLSSEERPFIVEKKPVLPRRGILKNKGMPSHQRSISAPLSTYPASSNTPALTLHPPSPAKGTVTFALDARPVISVTLPARDSNPTPITDNQQHGEGERDRAMSELLEGLFMLSVGGNSSSSVSLSNTNENLDVPHIAIEQEDDFDVDEVASRDSSSFETSDGDLDLLSPPHASQLSTHRLSISAPSIFTKSFPWIPEEAQVDRTLQTKRSSSALPQATREANVIKLVAPVTQMPSPPATPVPEDIAPIEEEVDDIFDVRDVRTSEDGKLDVSTLSDDQWTLRAESINDGSIGKKSDGNLPRYSELLYSPTHAMFQEKEALVYQFIVKEKPKPEIGLIDEDFTIEGALSGSSHTVRYPPTRSTSLALPEARRLRSVPRTELLVERASQQWDREKVNGDVQKVAQRLRWDKAQKAWHLVQEVEQAPVAGGQIPNPSQHHGIPRNSLSLPRPRMVAKGAILPPGRMEWATVDSASPNPTGQPGLVFRLCISWRLATQYNAINHPFGAQEEIKAFVLGRTHEEFYQFYEGLMGRFMLEPRRHPLAQSEEVGPRARASFPPMEPPTDHEDTYSTIDGYKGDRVQEIGRKVDMLESWTQGFMKLKGTKMGFVLDSDYVRMWMAPRREGDCERSADDWRKDGHGEIGRDSEGIARVLERLW